MGTTGESALSSPLVQWMFALLLGVFVIFAAIRLWSEVEFSLYGMPASGKVLQHEGAASARTKGCTAELEVSRPGSAPYRTSMSDSLGDICEDGSTVSLLCFQSNAGGHRCEVDSWTRWMFPVIVLGIGAGLVVLRLRQAMKRK